MKSAKVIIFLSFLYVNFLFLAPAFTFAANYEINWWNVTKRIYEDERGNKNILQFAVTYPQGNYVLGTNGEFVDFESVELYDPSDKKVDISDINFIPDYEYVGGSFDTTSGGWNYGSMTILYEFQAEILEPVVPGEYELRLRCNDGVTYTATQTFNQIVTVPLISKKSYQIHPDSNGNVYFSWDIPAELIQLSQTYNFIYRPGVAVYEGDTLVALLYPTAPIHINMLFVPNSLVQWLASKGSTFTFSVQVRTSDSQNRSHPIPLTVSDMLATVPKKKQVAVVPMF